MTIRKISEINWKRVRPNRGGVIPYKIVEGKFFFCLGVDTKSQDLTDFGGGIWGGESVIEGCLREFMEESLLAFGEFKVENGHNIYNRFSAFGEYRLIGDCHVIYNRSTMIIFLPVKCDMETTSRIFNQRVSTYYNPEVKSIRWIESDHFLPAIRNASSKWGDVELKLYSRVAKLLAPTGEFWKSFH